MMTDPVAAQVALEHALAARVAWHLVYEGRSPMRAVCAALDDLCLGSVPHYQTRAEQRRAERERQRRVWAAKACRPPTVGVKADLLAELRRGPGTARDLAERIGRPGSRGVGAALSQMAARGHVSGHTGGVYRAAAETTPGEPDV